MGDGSLAAKPVRFGLWMSVGVGVGGEGLKTKFWKPKGLCPYGL